MNNMKSNPLGMTEIEVYKKILTGELKRFPYGFWQGEDGKKNSIEVMRYLIEDVLKWSKEDVKKNLIVLTFKKYKLAGMLKSLYDQSPYLAIESLYPGEFKPYSLKNAPKDYWNNNTVKEAIETLMCEMELTKEIFVSTVTKQMLVDNDLGGLLDYCNNSPYTALKIAFGDTFNPWDMVSAPNGYWTRHTAISSIKKLIEEDLKWSEDDIKNNISKSIFQQHNLSGMLNVVFGDSPYEALEAAYPGKFSPKDLKHKPKCA